MASSAFRRIASMQIEHKLSLQMEHSTQVPPQLMTSQVSPDMIPGLVIWKDTNAMKSYAQFGCIRLQTGAIIIILCEPAPTL